MADSRISDLVERLSSGNLSRRDFIRRATAAGVSASAVTAALAQHGNAAPNPASTRLSRYQADATTLVIADDISPTRGAWLTADPGWFYEINPAAMMNVVYEALYHFPDGTKVDAFEPLLADGMPVIADDQKSVTIKLKQGVKFHSTGNEMTSADWVFSWNRLVNLKYQGSFLVAEVCDGFEAVDPYTLKLTWNAPRAQLVQALASIPLSVLDSKFLMENGGTDAADADTTDTAKDVLDGVSAGTGPYMLTKWDLNSEVVVEKNPDYWGEAAKLDRIIWRLASQPSAQVSLVENGEVDIAYHLDPDKAQSVRDNPDLQLISGPTLAIQYLGMKVSDDETADYGCTCAGPLLKKEVRQAIGYAIDYDGIISGLLGGAGLHPATTVPEPLLGTVEVREFAYKQDLAKAQALFDASGLGEAEVTLSYDSGGFGEGAVSLDALAAKLQSDIQQIKGLTFNINPMDGTQRITDYRAGKLQATVSPWTPDYADVNTYTGPFAQTGVAAAKRVGYSNPQVDAWLAQGIAEIDVEKRREIYINILKTMIDDAAFLVLYQTVDQKPARSTVQGVTVHPVFIIQLRFASKTA
ncbi:MAG: ABC transporter substrate-binding protein [Thermomicrobiales bacterium]|nr:ABC transporter substrate-binding protein [Thermomicrobiales bacterium]